MNPESSSENNIDTRTSSSWMNLENPDEVEILTEEFAAITMKHHDKSGWCRINVRKDEGENKKECSFLLLSCTVDALLALKKYPDDADIMRLTEYEKEELSEHGPMRIEDLYNFYIRFSLREIFESKKFKRIVG